MKRRILPPAVVVVLTFWATSFSHASVIPNHLAATEGDNFFFFSDTTYTRTYQMTISAGQLGGLVGQTLSGMQWRLDGLTTPTWPSVDTNYSFFDVFIGAGVAPSATTNTFASNFAGTPTQVRSGAFTFPANSFIGGLAPNAFGAALTFDTGYVYTGGHLTIELRYSQQSGATNQPKFDAVGAFGGPANGWGVDFAARWINSSVSTDGGPANFLVTNFETGGTRPIPEPATIGMFAFGFAALVMLRKRKSA